MPWIDLPDDSLWNHRLESSTYVGTVDPYPKLFLTGDGHNRPPFQWLGQQQSLREHLEHLLLANKVCVYVEEHQGDVTADSVDASLRPAFYAGRIFGWELPIYRHLGPVMAQCLMPVTSSAQAIQLADAMLDISTQLPQVPGSDSLAALTGEILLFRAHYHALGNENRATSEFALDIQGFPGRYCNAAMSMRTDVNREIGFAIQSKIDQYSECTHLITCGDAHLRVNPLQNYIRVPAGGFGVIDRGHR